MSLGGALFPGFAIVPTFGIRTPGGGGTGFDGRVATAVAVAAAVDEGAAAAVLDEGAAPALVEGAAAVSDAVGAGIGSFATVIPGVGIFSVLAPVELAVVLPHPAEAPAATSAPIDRPSAGLTMERSTRDVSMVFAMRAGYTIRLRSHDTRDASAGGAYSSGRSSSGSTLRRSGMPNSFAYSVTSATFVSAMSRE